MCLVTGSWGMTAAAACAHLSHPLQSYCHSTLASNAVHNREGASARPQVPLCWQARQLSMDCTTNDEYTDLPVPTQTADASLIRYYAMHGPRLSHVSPQLSRTPLVTLTPLAQELSTHSHVLYLTQFTAAVRPYNGQFTPITLASATPNATVAPLHHTGAGVFHRPARPARRTSPPRP